VGAAGLEWQTPSPPPVHNFDEPPIAPERPYDYRSGSTTVTRVDAEAGPRARGPLARTSRT